MELQQIKMKTGKRMTVLHTPKRPSRTPKSPLNGKGEEKREKEIIFIAY